MERIKVQLDAIAPYVDEIVCYQYLGLMDRPNSATPAGPPAAQQLYNDYLAYLTKLNVSLPQNGSTPATGRWALFRRRNLRSVVKIRVQFRSSGLSIDGTSSPGGVDIDSRQPARIRTVL